MSLERFFCRISLDVVAAQLVGVLATIDDNTSDASLLGAPENWGPLPVRELRLAAGAGYVYAVCGEIRTMPGLSSHPAAERIDIDAGGNIVGLS